MQENIGKFPPGVRNNKPKPFLFIDVDDSLEEENVSPQRSFERSADISEDQCPDSDPNESDHAQDLNLLEDVIPQEGFYNMVECPQLEDQDEGSQVFTEKDSLEEADGLTNNTGYPEQCTNESCDESSSGEKSPMVTPAKQDSNQLQGSQLIQFEEYKQEEKDSDQYQSSASIRRRAPWPANEDNQVMSRFNFELDLPTQQQESSEGPTMSDRIYDKQGQSPDQRVSSRQNTNTSRSEAVTENSDDRATRLLREDQLEYQIRRLEQMNEEAAQRLKEPQTCESDPNDDGDSYEMFERLAEEETAGEMAEIIPFYEAGRAEDEDQHDLLIENKVVSDPSPKDSAEEERQNNLHQLYVITEESASQQNTVAPSDRMSVGQLQQIRDSKTRLLQIQSPDELEQDGASVPFNTSIKEDKPRALSMKHQDSMTKNFNDYLSSSGQHRASDPSRNANKSQPFDESQQVFRPYDSSPSIKEKHVAPDPFQPNAQSHNTSKNTEEMPPLDLMSSYLRQRTPGIKDSELFSDEDLLNSNLGSQFEKYSKMIKGSEEDESASPPRRQSTDTKVNKLLKEVQQLQQLLQIKDQQLSLFKSMKANKMVEAEVQATPEVEDKLVQTFGPRKKSYYAQVQPKVNTGIQKNRSPSWEALEGTGRSGMYTISPRKNEKDTPPAHRGVFSPAGNPLPSDKDMQGDAKSLRAQLLLLKTQLTDQEVDNVALIERLTNMEAEHVDQAKFIQKLESQITEKLKQNDELQQQKQDMNSLIDSLRADNSELSRQLATYRLRENPRNFAEAESQTDNALWQEYNHHQFELGAEDDHQILSARSPQPQAFSDHFEGEQGAAGSGEFDRIHELISRANKYEQQYRLIEGEIADYKLQMIEQQAVQAQQTSFDIKPNSLYQMQQQFPPSQVTSSPNLDTNYENRQNDVLWLQNQYSLYKRRARKLEKRLNRYQIERMNYQQRLRELEFHLNQGNEKYRDIKSKFQMKLHERNLKITELRNQVAQYRFYFGPGQQQPMQVVDTQQEEEEVSQSNLLPSGPSFDRRPRSSDVKQSAVNNSNLSQGEIASLINGLVDKRLAEQYQSPLQVPSFVSQTPHQYPTNLHPQQQNWMQPQTRYLHEVDGIPHVQVVSPRESVRHERDKMHMSNSWQRQQQEDLRSSQTMNTQQLRMLAMANTNQSNQLKLNQHMQAFQHELVDDKENNDINNSVSLGGGDCSSTEQRIVNTQENNSGSSVSPDQTEIHHFDQHYQKINIQHEYSDSTPLTIKGTPSPQKKKLRARKAPRSVDPFSSKVKEISTNQSIDPEQAGFTFQRVQLNQSRNEGSNYGQKPTLKSMITDTQGSVESQNNQKLFKSGEGQISKILRNSGHFKEIIEQSSVQTGSDANRYSLTIEPRNQDSIERGQQRMTELRQRYLN